MINEKSNSEYPISEEHLKFYRRYLFDLLPEIYKEQDKDHVLKEFLEIIGEQAAAVRQNIDDMWNNFFIDTCEDWVIPYIGDLVGTKIISNPASDNRIDVKKTLNWRKTKGTLTGIQSLTKSTARVGTDIVEFYKLCSRVPHLNYFNENFSSNCTVLVREQKPLHNIGAVNDTIPHTIDVRKPSYQKGWYNIKNIGLFVSMLYTYHVEKVEALKENDFRFYFNSVLHKNRMPDPIPLYELHTKMEIPLESFNFEPQKYFGNDDAFTICVNSVPAAVFNIPKPISEILKNGFENLVTISSTSKFTDSPNTNFVGLHEKYGIRLLEPRKFGNPEKYFRISIYSYSENNELIEIGYLDTLENLTSNFIKITDIFESGKLVICIELGENSIPSSFPETIIAIRDTRIPQTSTENNSKDGVESRYTNSLYVYLPSIPFPFSSREKKVLLFVDKIGSAYFTKFKDNVLVIDPAKKQTESLGQIYPPRKLTFSLNSLTGYGELNRLNGIQAIDPSKFHDDYVVEAFSENESQTDAWKIGELHISSDSTKYVNAHEVWIKWSINNPSSDGINQNNSPLKLITHFKSIRERKNIPYSLNEFQNSDSTDKFIDILAGNEDQQKEIIKKITQNALGSLYEKVANIQVKSNNDLNLKNNCSEFEVTINLLSSILDDPVEKSIKTAIDEYPLFKNEGKLFLKIISATKSRAIFPMCTLMVKDADDNHDNKLIYLPQVDLESSDPVRIFSIADDGSTFYNDINPYNLARKSAGQCAPIPDRYPIQHRIPLYLDMTNWENHTRNTVLPGELAIDPKNGRFAFSEIDGEVSQITTNFNYAFGLGIGSGSYDRISHKPNLNGKATNSFGDRIDRNDVVSNYKWITKAGHGRGPNLLPSKTFRSFSEIHSKLNDNDVIELIDNYQYEMETPFKVPNNVKNLTIQARNQSIPKIVLNKKNEIREFTIEGNFDSLTLSGLTFVGGRLRIKGNVKHLVITSCTINPDYDENFSIVIESDLNFESKISLHKSIVGGISVSNPSTMFEIQESIIENKTGSFIEIQTSQDKKISSNFIFDIERSTVIGKQDSVLNVKELRASEVIFVGKFSIFDSENSWIRFCRYEPGSILPTLKLDNTIRPVAFRCTTDKPLFLSTKYGNPHYMNLHHLTSKKIIYGGEGSSSIGAYNQAYQFHLLKKLQTRLNEYLPFGIQKSLIHI